MAQDRDFGSIHRHVAKLRPASHDATQLRHMTMPLREPIKMYDACADIAHPNSTAARHNLAPH